MEIGMQAVMCMHFRKYQSENGQYREEKAKAEEKDHAVRF